MTRTPSGQFAAGHSGNPGGRPGRDLVETRLRGKRARSALLKLAEALAGQLTVIVLDARNMGARIASLPDGLAPSTAALEGLAQLAAQQRQSADRAAATAELAAAGWQEQREPAAPGRHPGEYRRMWHGPDGQRLDWLAWDALQLRTARLTGLKRAIAAELMAAGWSIVGGPRAPGLPGGEVAIGWRDPDTGGVMPMAAWQAWLQELATARLDASETPQAGLTEHTKPA